jgi:hypothetical protein
MGTKKNRLWAGLALVVAVMGFTACLKTENTPPDLNWTYIYFINGVTSVPSIDIFEGSQKLNTQGPFNMGTSTNPYQTRPGFLTFAAKKSGADSAIASVTSNYDSSKRKTIIFYDRAPQGGAYYEIPEENTCSNCETGKLNFRFFNLSPNSPEVDLYIDNKKIDSSVTPGSFNPTFKQTDMMGSGAIRVKITGKDSTLAEVNTTGIGQGGAYTIYFTGLKGNTGDRKPTIGVQQVY